MVPCLTSSPNQLRLTGTHLNWFKWKPVLCYSVTSQELLPMLRRNYCIEIRNASLSSNASFISNLPNPCIGRHAALINRHRPKSIFEAWFDASPDDFNTYFFQYVKWRYPPHHLHIQKLLSITKVGFKKLKSRVPNIIMYSDIFNNNSIIGIGFIKLDTLALIRTKFPNFWTSIIT